MDAKLVKIGNSKGIIIPSKLLKLLNIQEKANLEVVDNKLVIAPVEKAPRAGWEEQIRKEVSKNDQTEPLMPDFFEDENHTEWEW